MLGVFLKYAGLAVPFIYAAATYGIFRFLDKKASGQAKKAISTWIGSANIDKQQSAAVALEIFDRIYTTRYGVGAQSRDLCFSRR